MRFKIYPLKSGHGDVASCVGWLSAEEVVSAGDDHRLIFWNSSTLEVTKTVELAPEIFPTDLHVLPKRTSNNRQSSPTTFAIGSTDGSFYIFDRSGRIEKSVQAHQGALLSIRWSNDGTALASGGEDGCVKIWSKAGMLRSTLATHVTPVHCLSWSPNSDSVIYGVENSLEIKSLSPKIKPVFWKAHDGIILKISWNPCNHTIVSGSEDCRYRIWDENGRLLYSSSKTHYPIWSLSFSPDGYLLGVGTFNGIFLCDQRGWSYTLTKVDVQTVINIAWSSDSTQITASTGSGSVILGHVVGKQLDWKSFQICAMERKMVRVTDIDKNTEDDYDFRDNIIKLCVGFGYLIVITTSQCHIYRISDGKAQQTFNLKEPTISSVLLSANHFILVDAINVNLCSYEGRYLHVLKWIGQRIDFLTVKTLALSIDSVAAVDANDNKTIYFIDLLSSSKSTSMAENTQSYKHKIEVLQVALDQCGPISERKCAFVDRNSDLYIVLIKHGSLGVLRSIKCRSTMTNILWCDEASILSGLSDNGKLIIWPYPQVGFIDKDLLDMSVMELDLMNSRFKAIELLSFSGNHVSLGRSDGSILTSYVTPFAKILHAKVADKKWPETLRLCRYLRGLPVSWKMWSTLAGMALQHRNLEVAELAYSAIDKVDKVFYIQKLQRLSDKSARSAEIALICGNIKESENILLASRYILRAIQLNLETYNWDRAIDLMVNHDRNKKYEPLILYYRKRYLERFNKTEDDPKLKKIFDENNIEDWTTVEEWISDPYAERMEAPPVPSSNSARKPTLKSSVPAQTRVRKKVTTKKTEKSAA